MDVEIDNDSYLNERCQYVYRVDQGSMEVSLITSKNQSAVMAGWETPISKFNIAIFVCSSHSCLL